MEMKDMRIRIPMNLYKKYKLICVEKDLSLAKQASALIKQFVEIQEENNIRIKKEL